MTYNRLRVTYHRSCLNDLVLKATYGKNLIRGSKLFMLFELFYAIQARIIDEVDPLMPPHASLIAQQTPSAHNPVSLMLREPPHVLKKASLLPTFSACF